MIRKTDLVEHGGYTDQEVVKWLNVGAADKPT